MVGCPGGCVYCDQRTISGVQAPPSASEVGAILLARLPAEPVEVAFYGGSFTALPWPRQQAYLEAVAPYLAAGRVSGIRLSTRPDCLDRSLCRRLQAAGVRTIELGVQSFDDAVLRQSGRQYDARQADEACRLVQEAGLDLGIQLMTGLPGDDGAASRFSAQKLVELRPTVARVYPTLVLEGTALAAWWRWGQYRPQSLAQAVALCRDLKALCDRAAVPVIRWGLHPSAELAASCLAGPYHPAFGHLVACALKREQLRFLCRHKQVEREATLAFPPADEPLINGHRKANRLWLLERYGPCRWRPQAPLPPQSLLLEQAGRTTFLSYAAFLAAYDNTIPLHTKEDLDVSQAHGPGGV